MNPFLIIFLVLFVVGIGVLTYFTTRKKDVIPNDPQSENKIVVVNEALSSAMGRHWPIFLLLLTILIGAVFGLLYLVSRTELSVVLEDGKAKVLNTILIVLGVILTILVIVLGVKDYLAYRNQQNNPNIPNYTPTKKESQFDTRIVYILALILLIFFGGGFGVYYMFRK